MIHLGVNLAYSMSEGHHTSVSWVNCFAILSQFQVKTTCLNSHKDISLLSAIALVGTFNKENIVYVSINSIKVKIEDPVKYLAPEIITIYITSINAVNITSNLVAGPEFRSPHRVASPSNVTNAVADTAQSATAAPPRHLRG